MNKTKKIFSFILGVAALVSFAGCNGAKEDITKVDVTASCTLKRSAKDKTFDSDGIEECVITRYTDGDTSGIKGKKSGKSYTIRYLAIDTPESTAGYDKWGKAASVWNEETLSKAESYIVEAEGSTPEKDTNGTRYLGYIWYKLPNETNYRLYNLECVENGYSKNNCPATGKYYEYFQKAHEKAQKLKLHVFGDDEDIYYPEKVNNVSLKELKANPDKYYDKSTSIPTCVSFKAYITDLGTGDFRTVTVEQYDETDGKYYTYQVVIGYSGSRIFTISTKNSLMRFIGWTTGEGSIHGCTALAGASEDSMYTIREMQNYYNENLSMQVTKAEVSNKTLTLTGVVNINDSNKTVTFSVTDDSFAAEGYTPDFEGKTVTASKAFAKTKELEAFTINKLSELKVS